MIPALAEKYTALEERRGRLLDNVRSLSEEQRSFQRGPGSWSALQVAQHVFIAEQVGVDTMVRLRERTSRRKNPTQRLGYAAVWLILKLGLRVRNPARRTNPDGEISFQELEGEWDDVRQRLREYLDDLDESGPTKAGFMHPVAGPLNLKEALLFMQRHLDHHLRQLDRIRQHPKFPAA